MKIVGKIAKRIEGKEKGYGESKYTADLYLDRMLYAGVVYSNIPHGILKSIDVSEAEKIPGIVKVATYKDVPGTNKFGVVTKDMWFLIPVGEKIRFEHDAIAVIAGESKEAVEEAVSKVKFEVEELRPVLTIEEAIKDEIKVNDENTNVAFHKKIRRGDVDKVFKEADLIIERDFKTDYQEQAYLEPQGAIADYDGEVMKIYASMQCPFYVQEDVSEILDMPFNKIDVIQMETGGGFGGKEDVPSYIASKAALLSYLTKRPVKLIYEREHDIKETSKRHPSKSHYKAAFKKDGTLIGLKSETYLDMGAYSTLSPIVMYRTLTHSAGAYKVSNVYVDVYGVYTNKVPCGAFRGFGSPQVLFAIESIMDEAAEKLGLDPYDIRLKNALDLGDETATGHKLEFSVGAKKTLEHVKNMSKYDDLKKEIEDFNKKNKFKKRGLGWSHIIYGVSLGAGGQHLDAANSEVHVFPDGTINIMFGGTEIGQGAKTAVSMIVSEVLGQKLEKIHVLQTDTFIVQDSGPTVASRTTVFSGNAAKDAAEKIKKNIIDFLCKKFDVSPDEIKIELGVYKIKDNTFTFGEIAKMCNDANVQLNESGWFKSPKLKFDMENGVGEAYVTYTYSTQLSLVEVDILTGKIDVKKMWISHDIGKAINYDGVIGQIQGGAVQGMGHAIMEEIKQKDGKIISDNFNNYIIPTIKDIPEIIPDVVEEEFPYGPFGAKGIGEPSLMSAPPSIANAVSNAIKRRIIKIPISIEDII
ncbi:CO or xanthine dehydrogenase, Mo-binding subunit [Marinitoga hydrogenitolerans DSM 16785]|uniref:CO or xanthine dehydrogenase, Mo-binding subunit n=1 Tax=Marinitoga hydrogenitolerans (strain DSM 16785 / JCM 12826 / AT1271) TaxID=1122195 RepID=A0A1M4T0B8_MARH1|nr:xanthine dehydrogenase family protein molybdopterin-binding subunit [Marinitoga hydrogenitolerans]SHE37810.1 CO or xanthine dehydrogenase, Mo-binding subunit [Marinitoga hydrogenitolerans DSM 16785]